MPKAVQAKRASGRPIGGNGAAVDWRDFTWKGDNLLGRGRVMLTIVPDAVYPTMWRVRLPDGGFTDMVNRTRAKDVAKTIARQRCSELSAGELIEGPTDTASSGECHAGS
jgi:hypothetical protein